MESSRCQDAFARANRRSSCALGSWAEAPSRTDFATYFALVTFAPAISIAASKRDRLRRRVDPRVPSESHVRVSLGRRGASPNRAVRHSVFAFAGLEQRREYASSRARSAEASRVVLCDGHFHHFEFFRHEVHRLSKEKADERMKSIVVPCYNEAKNLPNLIARFEALTDGAPVDWEARAREQRQRRRQRGGLRAREPAVHRAEQISRASSPCLRRTSVTGTAS